MEKVNPKKHFWIGAVLGMIVFATLWFAPWRFETNDDVIMMWLVSGAYTGETESYAVFIHPFLSWIFARFYSLFPEIQWYPLVWFCTLYLSFLGILSCILAKGASNKFKILVIIGVLALLIHFTIFLQFTIVSGIAGFAGFLLFENSREYSSWVSFAAAILLVVLSILIRWESFVLLSLGYAGYVLVFKSKKNILLRAKGAIPFGALFVVLVFCNQKYVKNNGYTEFVTYTKARSSVFDHPVFYTLNRDDQLPENTNWFFFANSLMDGDNITVEMLNDFKFQLDQRLFTLRQVGRAFYRLIDVLQFQNFRIAYSSIIILSFILTFWKSPKFLIFIPVWFGFMLVFNHFYVVNARVYILFFMPFIYPIILDSEIKEIKLSTLLPAYLIILVSLIIHGRNFFLEAERRNSIELEFNNNMAMVEPGKLVVFEGFMQNFLPVNFTLFEPVPYLSTGWVSNSPFQDKALKNKGVAGFSGISNFYLIGFYDEHEFHFPNYMKFLNKPFKLNSSNSGSHLMLNCYFQED